MKYRTSKEIYSRIKWESSFDPSQFKIGYENRGDQAKEVPFSQFDPQGEIPWHRVIYFKWKEITIWDRKNRTDLLEDLYKRRYEQLEKAEGPALSRGAVLRRNLKGAIKTQGGLPEPKPSFKYDGNLKNWTRSVGSEMSPDSLGIVTLLNFNVLCDVYEAEKIYTSLRIPSTLSFLQKTASDLILLQEVTSEFAAALL